MKEHLPLDFLHLFWQCRGICSSSGSWLRVCTNLCLETESLPCSLLLTQMSERTSPAVFWGPKCFSGRARLLKLVGVCPTVSWNTQLHLLSICCCSLIEMTTRPLVPSPQLFAALKSSGTQWRTLLHISIVRLFLSSSNAQLSENSGV